MPTQPARTDLEQPPCRGRRLDAAAGLIAVLVFVLLATARTLKLPLFSSADEVAHLDYAYQVWHHRLPDFYAGIVIDPVRGSGVPVQWVSQHPPLFYLLLAPVVGPLIDGGHVLAAGMAARGINIALGAAVVWCVGRAAGGLFPRLRGIGPVAALVTACCSWLLGVSSAVYNDSLAALASTLMLWGTGATILRGQSGKRRAVVVVAASVCLLSRLSTVAVVAPCLVALVGEGFARGRGRGRIGRWSGLITALVAGLGVLATSGWFYLRNVRLTGSVTGGHPEWAEANLGRHELALDQIVTPASLRGLLSVFDPTGHRALLGALLLVVPAVVLLALVLVRSAVRLARAGRARWGGSGTGPRRQRPRRPSGPVAVVVLLVTATLLVLAMQLAYSRSGGAISARYVLPVLLPFSTVVSGALTAWRPVAPLLLAVWTGIWARSMVHWWGTLPTHYDAASSWPTYTTASTVLLDAGLGVLAVGVVVASLGVLRGLAPAWRSPGNLAA